MAERLMYILRVWRSGVQKTDGPDLTQYCKRFTGTASAFTQKTVLPSGAMSRRWVSVKYTLVYFEM